MPIFQQALSLNNALSANTASQTIILNDLSTEREEDRKTIEELTITSYNGDKITLLPSCKCEKTKGFFPKGTYCALCGTEVHNDITNDIEHVLWFRKPRGINTLINPHYWLAIKDKLSTKGFCVVSYFSDTSYKPRVTIPPILGAFIKLGVTGRGYNYFVDNLFFIIEVALQIKTYKAKSAKILELLNDMRANPQNVFCDYLPLPNKSLLLIEYNNLGIYVDDSIRMIKDTISMMVGIDVMLFIKNVQNRTAKCMEGITTFYNKYFEINLKPKIGLIRKHIAGSRLNWAWRCVLVSITEPHEYDEIHVPWCVALVVWRDPILNKLMRSGYDLNTSVGIITRHINVYNKQIADILDEFIVSTGNKLHCIIHRNPSLLSGSAQLCRITKFKKDPLDRSMAQSIIGTKAMNSD